MTKLIRRSAALVLAGFVALSALLIVHQHRHVGTTSAAVSSSSPVMPSASMMPSSMPAASTRYYTVQAGDTLTGIARRIYGSSPDWWYIYQANKSQVDRLHGVLATGAPLAIPPVPGSRYTGQTMTSLSPSPMMS